MNKPMLLYLRALLAIAALLGFAYLYGRAMLEAAAGQTPQYTEAFIYVATVLAGLVGGVAATSLGQSYPLARAAGQRGAIFRQLGHVLAPLQAENLQTTLAVAYTVIYIFYGVAALILWIAAPGQAPIHELVRNLGLIFLGLAIATAQSFFGIQPVRASASAAKRKKR